MTKNNSFRFSSDADPGQFATAYQNYGCLIIENFYSHAECAALRQRMHSLIEGYDPSEHKTVFSSVNAKHANDDYFLTSGDKIRFFLEEGALDRQGELTCPKHLAVNKVGHALHDLDPEFDKFSRKPQLAQIAEQIGLVNPLLLQSMYIFKQARHGGEVNAHQDSSFIYTEPHSCTGFWVALEDATVDNGCLWASPGLHREPLRSRFHYVNGQMRTELIDASPLEAGKVPLEATEGTLVMLHGCLPHNSSANSSDKSRQAYTLHCISGDSAYAPDNWLQRPSEMPLRGFTG